MHIKGIIPALVTPMTREQTVNEPILRQLTRRVLDAGVHGVFALGTNGEFHLLTAAEKVQIAACVMDEVAGKVPVIVGTGGGSTAEVIALNKKMEALKIDALSIITPYFIPASQAEVYTHFATIAENTSLPIILYNIPARTGINLEPETAAKLARIPNIIGIKDSSGNFANIEQYIHRTKHENFSVYAGTDSLILKALLAGGKGAIAATANMIPENVVAIYDHWLKGNIEEATQAQKSLQPLRDTFSYGTLPSVIKKAVELTGLAVGPPRLPVSELSGESLEKVKDMVAYYNKLQG
ncbi:4-hydroxy-tetrahydrodipicolinate synthase [Desmospora activa]|uniref:4-hydroxy-tetrahydrodipicolinate synthase n=1 Tax=Desmospora activa DSM 45169 TaxID=1121389 RepID=A0A2T4Z3T1_9BACL|nr:4-hydroxy-tetrahydrodipicolinate synthase [Desmospora activa]PTM56550.1 4-hydroxy-tetrahydrodipicolinate synthase [Desmospora activa DSM 45169]